MVVDVFEVVVDVFEVVVGGFRSFLVLVLTRVYIRLYKHGNHFTFLQERIQSKKVPVPLQNRDEQIKLIIACFSQLFHNRSMI